MTKTEFDPFPPALDEVVVEIAGCGVCHTDFGFFNDGVRTNHPLPLTLGHEISGPVAAAGGDVVEWLSKAVIIPAVIPCGRCAFADAALFLLSDAARMITGQFVPVDSGQCI